MWTPAGFPDPQTRDHQREQRAARDVERHAEEDVRAALVRSMATEFAFTDVKLETATARGGRAMPCSPGIPRADDEAAAVRDSF